MKLVWALGFRYIRELQYPEVGQDMRCTMYIHVECCKHSNYFYFSDIISLTGA